MGELQLPESPKPLTPDLNPIEHIWDEKGYLLQARPYPILLPDFTNVLLIKYIQLPINTQKSCRHLSIPEDWILLWVTYQCHTGVYIPLAI